MFMNGRVRRLELRAWDLWYVNWVESTTSSPNGLTYVHSSTEKSVQQRFPTMRVEDFGCNSSARCAAVHICSVFTYKMSVSSTGTVHALHLAMLSLYLYCRVQGVNLD